jgi:hypothetical protein
MPSPVKNGSSSAAFCSPLFEIALVLVRLDHVASGGVFPAPIPT